MIGRAVSCASLMALLISFSVAAVATAQETSEQEASRLQKESLRLEADGLYQEGIDTAKRALALRENTLGTEHPDVAISLQGLGRLYLRSGNYDLARSAYERALTVREHALGPEHQDTAASLTSLAGFHLHTRAFSKAEPLYQRALAILERGLGGEHIEISKALMGLANVYSQTAAFERAEPLFERALAIRERVSGAESADTALVLHSFGQMYQYMGAYARARVLARRALTIREKTLGTEHPETTFSLVSLATLYYITADYIEAEAMYKRALAIQERILGIEHPATAQTLINIACIYVETGAYSQAEPLFLRAISIQKKGPGSVPADTAQSLNNLASMYLIMGRYLQAEPIYRQAQEIADKSLGPAHSLTALIVGNLGDVYRRLGAHYRAEPLLSRAVAITEAAGGPEHSDTAYALHRLANLYYDRSAYTKAQPLYHRVGAIYEKGLGPEHPATARALRSLAALHFARRESRQALSLLQKVQRIQTKSSGRFLVAGSETRKQDYLRTLTEDTFQDVSFAMSTPGAAATVLGLTSVLQHKGRVLDAVSDNVARVRRSVAPADQALLDQLADVAGQLSTLTYGNGGNLSPEQYQGRLAKLTRQQEQLEADLAGRSRAFRREVTPVTLTNIQRVIPVDAALVELFRYTPFDPTKSIKAQRAPPRYVAYVLKHSGEPAAMDIGEAQALEALARRLRVALANPASSDVKQHSAALSAKLLAPLRVHLRGVEHLLFSPDGELNLVPMAALMDESGAYLGERFEVSYLTSGRDLLRIDTEPTAIADAVVVGDPDYGRRTALPPGNMPSLHPQRSTDLDRSGLLFRPLASTALEAQDLKALLQLNDANLLLGRDASEANLKRLKAPRILHIASHGFFLSNQQLTGEINKRRGSSAAPLAPIENPLLRSGIALSGANERNSGEDDGILTALEVTQLDLSRTELVVLSACDTGVGEVQNGEGVYGLRRALALASAQTQITSLSKVSDEATRTLMVDYYRRLLQGEGRSSALRRAQRAMLANTTSSHPYYWASFIPIGNWNPLSLHPDDRPTR